MSTQKLVQIMSMTGQIKSSLFSSLQGIASAKMSSRSSSPLLLSPFLTLFSS